MARKQKRHTNGEGTVRQRADGRYEVRVPRKDVAAIGCPPSFYGATAEEAIAKKEAVLRLADAGITMDAQTTTLGEYIERWLTMKASESRPNTINAYQHALSLAGPIYNLTLAQVLPPAVKALYTRLEAKGTSQSMRHKLHGKLKSVMKEAVIDGLLPSNPLDRMRGPKQPEASFAFWTEAQLLGFLRGIPEEDLSCALFYVFAFTGMRRGEVLGLHWHDLLRRDDGSAALRVQRSVVASRGGVSVMPPKTRQSRREISITNDVVAVRSRTEHESRSCAAHSAPSGTARRRSSPARWGPTSIRATPTGSSSAGSSAWRCPAYDCTIFVTRTPQSSSTTATTPASSATG